MARPAALHRILLVSGLSGAGKSTVLKALEDLGWEVIDNLPLDLVDPLLETPLPAGADESRPLAIGLDCRTRGFDPERIAERVRETRPHERRRLELLYLDCQTPELVRRFSENRRRHPLAPDRPAMDAIGEEREMTGPLLRAADHVIDTTEWDAKALRGEIRDRFGSESRDRPILSLVSFGFAQGLPRNADLVLDMRFLRNPHWEDGLRHLTGLDAEVAAHISGDEVFGRVMEQIETLLLTVLPRYHAEGRSYVSVAFGCTGGRHRSVHVAEHMAARLRKAGFSPTVEHRDLAATPGDVTRRSAKARAKDGFKVHQ